MSSPEDIERLLLDAVAELQRLRKLLHDHNLLRQDLADVREERDRFQRWANMGGAPLGEFCYATKGRRHPIYGVGFTVSGKTICQQCYIAQLEVQLAGARELFQEMVHADESGELRDSFPKLFALAALPDEAPKAP